MCSYIAGGMYVYTFWVEGMPEQMHVWRNPVHGFVSVYYIWLDAEWHEEFNSSGIIIIIHSMKYAEVINTSSAMHQMSSTILICIIDIV